MKPNKIFCATTDAWWAVALSEAVSAQKPLAAVFDGHALVVFRDSTGAAVALEDRCPHRRVPLSIGRIKEGHLQCAYHGWTFNGSTGSCTAIPNLDEGERVPARYAARAYPVREASGFVHVWLGATADSKALGASLPAEVYRPAGREFTGSTVVSLAYREYLAAMLDGPQALLEFDGVHLTDFFLGDTRPDGDSLVLDRGAVWRGSLPPPAFVNDHPLILRTAVPLAGGAIHLQLLTAQEAPVVTLHISAGTNRRGTTSLCWRGYLHDTRVSSAPLRWRNARMLGRAPFQVFSAIDGTALAAVLVQPSQQYVTASSGATTVALAAV
ncbi:MAG: rieske [2Fe-2S] domain protein [Polaromonas sp.]|nr:rieske [2Fe-2S] domain protein [Polaromonas sp.]